MERRASSTQRVHAFGDDDSSSGSDEDNRDYEPPVEVEWEAREERRTEPHEETRPAAPAVALLWRETPQLLLFGSHQLSDVARTVELVARINRWEYVQTRHNDGFGLLEGRHDRLPSADATRCVYLRRFVIDHGLVNGNRELPKQVYQHLIEGPARTLTDVQGNKHALDFERLSAAARRVALADVLTRLRGYAWNTDSPSFAAALVVLEDETNPMYYLRERAPPAATGASEQEVAAARDAQDALDRAAEQSHCSAIVAGVLHAFLIESVLHTLDEDSTHTTASERAEMHFETAVGHVDYTIKRHNFICSPTSVLMRVLRVSSLLPKRQAPIPLLPATADYASATAPLSVSADDVEPTSSADTGTAAAHTRVPHRRSAIRARSALARDRHVTFSGVAPLEAQANGPTPSGLRLNFGNHTG